MTSGTKVLLTLIALFVGVLVLYYGFLMPGGDMRTGRPAGTVHDPALQTSAADSKADGAVDGAVAPREPGRRSAGATPPRRAGGAPTGERLPAARSGAIDAPAADTAMDAAVSELVMGAATGGGAVRGGASARPLRHVAADEAKSAERADPPRVLASDTAEAPDLARPLPSARTPSGSGPGATTPAPARPEYTRYVVTDGDTMTSIAARWFGDANKWDLIAKANLVDPNRLKIGQVLRLPPRESRRERPGRATTGSAVEYEVRPGDTLSSIAGTYYGDPALWAAIHTANRAVIGSDPNALRVGMKLALPPAPRGAR